MIDEAIGKILGMAMAYFVSSLGLFLAYVNYRKRMVGAEKIMTPTAWGVVAAIVLAVVVGVVVVGQLAEAPTPAPAEAVVEAVEEPEEAGPPRTTRQQESRWPWIGIVLPAVIFLTATWITMGLYRHFRHEHPG